MDKKLNRLSTRTIEPGHIFSKGRITHLQLLLNNDESAYANMIGQ